MTYAHPRLALVWTLGVVCVACGKAPPPAPPIKIPEPPPVNVTIAAPVDAKVKASMLLAAGADVNPDTNGRASPIVIRVYQLRADAAFGTLEFFALFDNEKAALGPELITRDEYVLGPADRQTLDVTFASDARFIGVIAAFRDIRKAEWRAIVPVPGKGLNVTVERARVVVSAVN
jgi:type VI secretion system protein VasD